MSSILTISLARADDGIDIATKNPHRIAVTAARRAYTGTLAPTTIDEIIQKNAHLACASEGFDSFVINSI